MGKFNLDSFILKDFIYKKSHDKLIMYSDKFGFEKAQKGEVYLLLLKDKNFWGLGAYPYANIKKDKKMFEKLGLEPIIIMDENKARLIYMQQIKPKEIMKDPTITMSNYKVNKYKKKAEIYKRKYNNGAT